MSRILPLFLLALGLFSCSSDSGFGDVYFENNPLKGRFQILNFTNDIHRIELYSRDTALYEGYNNILLRIKDKKDNYISYATLEWEIFTTDSIIGFVTEIKQSLDNPDIYTSFLIFPEITQNNTWKLELTYQIQSNFYSATKDLVVNLPNPNKATVLEKTGIDSNKYLLALVDPYLPISGYNNCSILLYEKNLGKYTLQKEMDIYVWCSTDNYTQEEIFELIFRPNTDMYQAKIEIPSAGLWQLNLNIKNKFGESILGEEKSANHPNSSLHFPMITNSLIED